MAITRPISKTVISTLGWGIPITDEVNLLRSQVDTLRTQITYTPRLLANVGSATAWGPYQAQADIAGSLVGFTGKPGRICHFEALVPVLKAGADGTVYVEMANGAGGVFYSVGQTVLNNWSGVIRLDYWVAVPAGSVTYKLRIGCAAGGTVSSQPGTGTAWQFSVTEWVQNAPPT